MSVWKLGLKLSMLYFLYVLSFLPGLIWVFINIFYSFMQILSIILFCAILLILCFCFMIMCGLFIMYFIDKIYCLHIWKKIFEKDKIIIFLLFFVIYICKLIYTPFLIIPIIILCLQLRYRKTNNPKLNYFSLGLLALHILHVVVYVNYFNTLDIKDIWSWILILYGGTEYTIMWSASPIPDFLCGLYIPRHSLLWPDTTLQGMPDGWHSISGGMAQIITDSLGNKKVMGICPFVRLVGDLPPPTSYQPGNLFNYHLAYTLYELKLVGYHDWSYSLIADVNDNPQWVNGDDLSLSDIDWRLKYRFALYMESFKDYYNIPRENFNLHNSILELLAR